METGGYLHQACEAKESPVGMVLEMDTQWVQGRQTNGIKDIDRYRVVNLKGSVLCHTSKSIANSFTLFNSRFSASSFSKEST